MAQLYISTLHQQDLNVYDGVIKPSSDDRKLPGISKGRYIIPGVVNNDLSIEQPYELIENEVNRFNLPFVRITPFVSIIAHDEFLGVHINVSLPILKPIEFKPGRYCSNLVGYTGVNYMGLDITYPPVCVVQRTSNLQNGKAELSITCGLNPIHLILAIAPNEKKIISYLNLDANDYIPAGIAYYKAKMQFKL